MPESVWHRHGEWSLDVFSLGFIKVLTVSPFLHSGGDKHIKQVLYMHLPLSFPLTFLFESLQN